MSVRLVSQCLHIYALDTPIYWWSVFYFHICTGLGNILILLKSDADWTFKVYQPVYVLNYNKVAFPFYTVKDLGLTPTTEGLIKFVFSPCLCIFA